MEPKIQIILSPKTAAFILELLSQVSITADHPDLVGVATSITEARQQLQTALGDSPAQPPAG